MLLRNRQSRSFRKGRYDVFSLGLNAAFPANTVLMKQKCSALFPYWSSFLTAFAVLSLSFLAFGLFPFGKNTLAWGDMKQQVIPLMAEWKDILEGKSGLLWNFQNAGGMNFWGVFFFFLSSPFSFLVAFIPKENIYELVNVLVLLKLSLAALTAAYFFKKSAPKLKDPFVLFFSVSYALCGYGMLYYQNIVWLDVQLLFPILMVGLLQVLFEKRGALFTAALSLIIIVNYYLSYMALLALVFLSLFFLLYLVDKKDRGVATGKLGSCTVCSLLITAFVWLPSLLECLRSARTGDSVFQASGSLFTNLYTVLPILLCTAGIVVFPLFVPLFSVTAKRRALLWTICLFLIPMVIEPINRMWHTGSYQAFPVRYGYIPVLLILWYMADCLQESGNERTSSRAHSTTVVLASLLPLILSAGLLLFRFEKITNYTRSLWVNRDGFWALLSVVSGCGIALWLAVLFWRKKKLSRQRLSAVLITLCLIQGGYACAVFIGSSTNFPGTGKAVLRADGSIPDSGFYRVKQESKFCDVNLIGAAGFCTLNHYTSLTDRDYLYSIKELGYSSYWMETSGCCGTELTDILLSNKYLFNKNLRLKRIDGGDLGIILPTGMLPEKVGGGNRFALQNDLYRRVLQASGISDMEDAFLPYAPKFEHVFLRRKGERTFLKVQGEDAEISYKIEVSDPETLYFDAFYENSSRLKEKINGAFQVTVNGSILEKEYPCQGCNGILKLGNFEKEDVIVTIRLKKDVELRSFGVFGLKSRKSKAFVEALGKCAELHKEKNGIYGEAITEFQDESLFLSIPYDPGIKISVNGKACECKKVLNCFLEIPLEKGENHIGISYFPPGLKTGITLSGLGLVLALFLFLKRKEGKGGRVWNKIAWPLFLFVFSVLILVIYLAPVLIRMFPTA